MTPDLDALQAIVADVLQLRADALVPEAELDALGCDQLCRVEIAIAIEDEFGIEVLHESGWVTLGDIVAAVARPPGMSGGVPA